MEKDIEKRAMSGVSNTRITEQDIAIMRCFLKDARIAVSKAAEILKLPESTVRNRLNRLISEGVIDFVVQTNPSKLGYEVWVMLGIEVDLPELDTLANSLAEVPEVYSVSATTGGHDLLVAAVFRSNADFFEFLRRRLAVMPGVRKTTTYNFLKTYKRRLGFLPTTTDADTKQKETKKQVGRKKERRIPAART